jgi:truncated hemoglobin YjbI
MATLFKAPQKTGQAMGQRLQTRRFQNWRSEHGQRSWLSRLVDTMEEIARPGFGPIPCDPSSLVALRAQLARAASSPYGVSNFNRRN